MGNSGFFKIEAWGLGQRKTTIGLENKSMIKVLIRFFCSFYYPEYFIKVAK